MMQESDNIDKMLRALPAQNTRRSLWCVAIVVFALLLLLILLRVKFAGKWIFCAMYSLLVVAIIVVLYNPYMPAALRFSHTS